MWAVDGRCGWLTIDVGGSGHSDHGDGQWWPGVMVDGGLRKREEVCVCVMLQGVFVFGYKLWLRLVTLVFCWSSRSSNFGNCERPKTRLQLQSSTVLGISGLGQSWSSPVLVFFQSWDWTSKHYSSLFVVVGTQCVFVMLIYHSWLLTAVDGGGHLTCLCHSFPGVTFLLTGGGGVMWRVLATNRQWVVDSGGAVLVGWVVIDVVGLLTSLMGSFIALVMCGCCHC